MASEEYGSPSSSVDSSGIITVDNVHQADAWDSSDTESLVMEMKEHVYENGRRYHAFRAGRYPLPNDEDEQDRLDLMHHLYSMLLGGELHMAELKPETRRILDCGTGTGLWAIDMADRHPYAEVIGVDLSPIQPDIVPPNCKFVVDDLEDSWDYREAFDFIHMRGLGQSITDWQRLFQQAYDNISPGGVIQIVDIEVAAYSNDRTIPQDSALWVYQERINEAMGKLGRRDPHRLLEGFLKAAGWEQVKAVKKRVPWGPWAQDKRLKKIGHWSLANLEKGFKSYALAPFTRVLGMSIEEAEHLCDRALADIRDPNIHAYSIQWHISARRPLYEVQVEAMKKTRKR